MAFDRVWGHPEFQKAKWPARTSCVLDMLFRKHKRPPRPERSLTHCMKFWSIRNLPTILPQLTASILVYVCQLRCHLHAPL